MQSGWRVGSLFGIPLFIDPSWLLIFLLVVFLNGDDWQRRYPGWGMGTAYLAASLTALLFFSSVLLHELGHSLVARSQGIKVNSITLFLFGGIASIDQESKTPGQAFQVAIAGPAVSLGLFLLLSGLLSLLPGTTPLAILLGSIASINLILGLFNLIPGLPLDGGQVLKAAVWKATGSRLKGVRWAAKMGSTFGWLAIILGLWTFLLQGSFSGLWLMMLGWFGVQNATSYSRLTDLQEALLQLNAADAMTREFRVIDADMSLRQFADEYILSPSRYTVYFAASDGRYRGMVAVDDLHRVERSEWDHETLYRIIQPLNAIPTVTETTSLVEVIQQMESQQLRRMTVLSPAGAVAGVIDRGDIFQALAQKLEMPISDSLIKQIKEEGVYPPGLQLGAIAQATADTINPAKNP